MPELLLYDHPASICSQMARLALAEKGRPYTRRTVDIMETNEQFEAWYVALNPRAVVPTLRVDDEVVTDTLRIVNRVDDLDGPDLRAGDGVQDWLRDIMAPHYGVLLYRKRLEPDGTAKQIVARGELLARLRAERPDIEDLVTARLERNARFQALLKDPAAIQTHVDSTRDLVRRMAEAVARRPFLAGPSYSLADSFATAALARFTIHGFTDWWAGTPLEDYYARMKARPSFAAAAVVETGTERDL